MVQRRRGLPKAGGFWHLGKCSGRVTEFWSLVSREASASKNPAVSGIRVVPISLALETAWLQILAEWAHRSDFPKAPTVFGIFAFGAARRLPSREYEFCIISPSWPRCLEVLGGRGDCTE